MKRLLVLLGDGSPVSHDGRFAFAAFALAAGIQPEDVAKAYERTTNYDVAKTASQIRGIVSKGYTPLSCDKMKERGLCDAGMVAGLCHHIRSPISFWRIRSNQKFEGAPEPEARPLALLVATCSCNWKSKPLPGPMAIRFIANAHLMMLPDGEEASHSITYLEASKL